MRLFSGADRLESLRRRGVAKGELIDVTDEARKYGVQVTVCISKRLWTGLIQPYPFAQTKDCLSLSQLLSTLKTQHPVSPTTNTGTVLLPPSLLPVWFQGACYLKFFVYSPARAPKSILVQPFADPFPTFTPRFEESLPATLLVRTAETLRNFKFVAHAAEQALIQCMEAIVTQLIHTTPFQNEILAYVSNAVPNPFSPVPPDDYRAGLLADLDELLAILAKCAGLNPIPKIEALKSHYRALVSPLAAFRHILEDLLRFTVSGSDANAPYQRQVFSHLLNLYSDVNARLKRFETVVPSDSLAVVRFQIRLLAQSIGIPDSQFLADIESACASLVSNPSAHPLHGPARESRDAVVWH
jgi:hypothetical protein